MLTGFRPYLLLTLLCALLYLPGLVSVPPLDRDEARFAQASKQMLETGDFIDIRFQDTPRHKKPIGIYWLQSASVTATGAATSAIWAYRLPSLLGAWTAVLMTFALGKMLFDRRIGLAGAGVLAASLALILEAHQAKTDAVLLATVVAAQFALARLYLARRDASSAAPAGCWPAYAFWIAQGAGILVKGPITPMISLLTVIWLAVSDRERGWLRTLRPLSGLALTAAIVAPWTIAMLTAADGAFLATAVKSDLLPKLIGGQESHGAPPGYFLLLMPVFFWAGSLLAAPALVAAWRRRRDPAIGFCLAWLFPSWLAFELIPTKLPHYVMPMYPALALLTAAFALSAPALPDRGWRRWALHAYWALWALLGGVLAIGAVAAPIVVGDGFTVWSLLPAAVAAAAVVVPLRFVRQARLAHALAAAVVIGGLAMAGVWALVMPHLSALWVGRELDAALVRVAPLREEPVIVAGFNEPSLVFLLGTDTVMVDGAGAAQRLRLAGDAVVIVSDHEEAAFRKALGTRAATLRPLASVAGIQYSKGRRHVLTVYRWMDSDDG